MTSEPPVSPDRPIGGSPVPGGPPPPPLPAHPDKEAAAATPAPPRENAVKFTKTAALWSALIPGFLILIVLLIFIAQNTESTSFAFFGWHWNLPLGVAMLLAAVGGGLLTVAVGTGRILQLRRAAKKHHAAAVN